MSNKSYRAGYEVALGLLEVFICTWCSARLSFSLATRHCLGQIGYILASLFLPIIYNSTKSVPFCFWFSAGVLALSFIFAWILIGIDSSAPEEKQKQERKKSISIEEKKTLCGLSFEAWLILFVGSLLQGLVQGVTILLSGYGQKLFYYSNQEGAFLIV